MVLELIKVFEGSFGGAVLYENEAYVSPNLLRRHAKVVRSAKYELKSAAKKASNERHEKFVKRLTVSNFFLSRILGWLIFFLISHTHAFVP